MYILERYELSASFRVSFDNFVGREVSLKNTLLVKQSESRFSAFVCMIMGLAVYVRLHPSGYRFMSALCPDINALCPPLHM